MPEYLIKPDADIDLANAILVSGTDPVTLEAADVQRGVALRIFQLTPAETTLTFVQQPSINTVSVTPEGANLDVSIVATGMSNGDIVNWSLVPAAGGTAVASGMFTWPTQTITLPDDLPETSYILVVNVGDSLDAQSAQFDLAYAIVSNVTILSAQSSIETSLTATFTVDLSAGVSGDRVLIWVYMGTSMSGVTINGQAMTRRAAASAEGFSGARIDCYEYVLTADGTATTSVVLTALAETNRWTMVPVLTKWQISDDTGLTVRDVSTATASVTPTNGTNQIIAVAGSRTIAGLSWVVPTETDRAEAQTQGISIALAPADRTISQYDSTINVTDRGGLSVICLEPAS